MKPIKAALLWNPKLAVTYKWKLCNDVKCGKKEEKWILPPSVGASHYTSKESFSLSRHPINHRVIFHHQLLVSSTLVFSALTWEMEWETLEKRAASSRLSHQCFCQAMNARVGLEFMAWNPVLAADRALYWTLQVLLLSARTHAFTGTYTVMKTGVRPFMAMLGSVKHSLECEWMTFGNELLCRSESVEPSRWCVENWSGRTWEDKRIHPLF